MVECYDFTKDENVVADKAYYKKDGETYALASLKELGGVGAGIPEATFYERYGKYVLNATNKIGENSITGHYYATAVSTTPNGMESAPLISPHKVLLSPPAKAVFNSELEIGGKEINKDTLIPEVIIPEKNSAEYIWSIKRYGEEEFSILPGVITNSYSPTEEAFYGVKVKTTRNLDSVITDNQLVYCVTRAPKEEDIIIGSIASSYRDDTVLVVDATFTPTNPIAIPSLSYQWYSIVIEDDNEIKTAIEGATTDEYRARTGKYRCEVTAHYNDLTYTKSTDIYNVG